MDNSPEANSSKAQNQEQIRFQQLWDKFEETLAEKLRVIESSDKPQEQKNQERAELSDRAMNELKEKMTALESIKKSQENKTNITETEGKQLENAKQGVKDALAKTIISAAKDLKLTEDKKAQAILNELAKGPISAEQAGKIAEKFGPYITGEKEIIITKPGEERSEFLKDVDSFKSEDPVIHEKMKGVVTNRYELFNLTKDQKDEVFPNDIKEQKEDQKKADYEYTREAMFDRDKVEYYGRFTQEQQDFLHSLYTPTAFKNYVENEINNPKGVNLQELKKAYKTDIIKIYQEQGKDILGEGELNKLVDNRWRQQVSQNIEVELGKVMNQMLFRLQQEGGNKFYDELAQEDFMRGIRATENQIRNAIITLQSSLDSLENDPGYKNIKLYKFFDKGHYTEERESDINPEEKRDLTYWRLHPLLQPKEVNLKEFAFQLSVDMDHLLDQRNYLHDSRVVFNQPPGEHGFYKGLGGYAEKYRGVDVDEMMLMPDGNLSLEAFHLYEKYLEEDFASLDWKHRPTEFTNELEYVNSQLERDIIAQMKLEYGNEVSEDRIRAAVNIGVGLARGVFLTEPEKSAYADAVDNEGRGMVASYGTNDAGALNALNPLHVELRWQGEHHMFMYYFMPIRGHEGMMWDHKTLWDNAGKYYESYKNGRRDLPKNLFIDEMIGVTKAGGPFTRKGWRMQASLEGHFRYKTDEHGNKTNQVDALETFKAMDYIGYEAVADFLSSKSLNAGIKMLKAEEGTKEAGERREFFKYVYEKYFKEFDGADFDGYMADLKKQGEKKALKLVKDKKNFTAKVDNWNEQIELETSKIFLDRALMREIALRFPSKFLRIDRGRFQEDGISRWQKIQKELGMSRDDFNAAMKDFIFTETLLRKEMSQKIKDQLRLDPTLDLNKVKINYESLNKETIERLLKETKGIGKDGRSLMTPERIENVKRIYDAIRKNYLNGGFLNGEIIESIKKYPFSFGVEDTDLGLMAFRGTGPRMVARAINDTGILEQGAVSAISKLGRTLQQMAIDGKQDFSPIIEAMLKARQAFNDVHGTGDDQKFNYNIATAVIQYFKKDSMAKPLFGLFRIGKRNSWAAEYAGRSSAVWEWDSRDIDRFCTALESHRILPKTAFDPFEIKRKGEEYENIFWINPITKKPFKTPFKKLKKDWEWNGARLRKEFGGDWKGMTFDIINNFLPIVIGYLLWKYLKDALDEASGKKKQ